MTASPQQRRDDLIRTLFNLPESRTTFTKSQQAYADVRKAIVTHSLPAGTPLDEAYLLSLFSFGRTPLREALKRLSHEGLLSWRSHQAPTVRDVGIHEMHHLYETRWMLEPAIAVLAARRATSEDHVKIEKVLDGMIRASELGDIYLSVEHDYALHAAIANSTQNSFLAEASHQLNLRSLRLWYRNQAAHGLSMVHALHAEIVESIINRDEARAEHLASEHISRSLQRQTTALHQLRESNHL